MTDPGSRRLKVLLLTTAMTAGGSQRYLSILLNHLDHTEFELQLATISDTRVEYTLPDDVSVHVVMSEEPAQPGIASVSPPDITELFVGDAAWVPSVADRLVTLVRRLQPDVVMCTPEHTAVLAAVASPAFPAHTRLLCRIPALPSKAFPRTGAGAGFSALARRVLGMADMTAVNSPAIARELADEFGIGHDDIAVMQNPIDIRGIRKLAELPVDEVEMADGIPTVVFVGRLERIKGLEYLLQAVAEVAAETRLRCVLVGEGSQRGYLRALSKHLGIADLVHFVGQQDNPFRFMGRATLFVLPSLSEGMPNVLVEAMACGTPVIATDIEGGIVRELLAGECGIVVPREDAGALATAMRDIVADCSLRERLIACGEARATRFDLPATIAQSADVLFTAAERVKETCADVASGDGARSGSGGRVEPASGSGQEALSARVNRLSGIVRGGGLRGLATHTRAWLGVKRRQLGRRLPSRRTSALKITHARDLSASPDRIRVTVLVPSLEDGFVGEGLPALLGGLDHSVFDVAVASLYAPIPREDLPGGAVGYVVPSVAVVPAPGGEEIDPDVIMRNQLPFREMTSLSHGFAQLTDALDTDVVYAVGFYAGTLAMMARAHMSSRTPCVLCVPTMMRQIADSTAHPELYAALMRAYASQADAVVVPDEVILGDIEAALSPLPGVIEVIPGPVEVPEVHVPTHGDDTLADRALVVTCIEEGDQGALCCVADAMVAVRRWADLHSVVFGDASLEARVNALGAEHGLGDSLRYGGRRPDDDIWRAAAAYVNPATMMVREHTQGVLRAVVAGCPVVSSRLSVADCRLLSAHGARAVLTTPGDALGIADAILQYVWDDDERRAVVEGARQNLDAVSSDTCVPRFERLLKRIVTESRGGVTPV